MADKNLDYEALTNEIAEKDTELTPERMVEMRKELEGVEFADRNDDHTFVWNELAEKARETIDELSTVSLDNLSADQLDSLKSLVSEFSSSVQGEYSGTAATLMKNIDARYTALSQEAADGALNNTEENQDISGTPTNEEEKDATIDTPTNEEEKDDAPTTETPIDSKDAAFLDSITDENKQEIIDRYERLDNVAEELGDVFAKDEDGNYKVSGEGFNFQGLESFYDNVYIDADIPENPDEKPSEELRNKRDWLKDEAQTLAINLTLKDLVQDGSIDEIQDKEKLKQRFAETVHDNMTFLTYSLVSTQAGFEAMSEGRNPDKMPPKDREAFLSAMRDKSANTAQVVSGILSGNDKTAVKLTTPGITATFAPYHQETESFAKGLKEKTGIGKLWNKVKAFDDKMTQKHPILWGFAKSSAISATLGPVGIAAMVGSSTYKQFKGLKKEYNKQKAENGGEMKLWDFVKKNPGKIASATVSVVATGIASYAGVDAALAGNFGIAGNVTGALLSGDAPNALSSVGSISFEHIAEAGKNMINSVADINHLNVQDVADGIKNSWTPTRTLRSAMNIGAGFAKSAEAYMKAEDGNKWSAAKKVFCGTVIGLVAGNALADVTTAAAHEYQEVQAYEHMKAEIEASEKAFQQELEKADFSDIKIPLPPDYTVDGGELPEVTVTGHTHHNTNEAPTQNIEAINLEEIQPVKLTPEPTLNGPENIEVKQVYNVNGEQVAVAQAETIEQTLDNARQEYLDNHPEIDDAQNKVEIEGNGVEATIKTEKEDIMSNDNEAVIGQETEIDRKIEAGNVEIKDHIEKTVTDTGKAEMQESTGRVDYNSNNNIPDGAKVTGAYHFENDNQKLDITSYEVDGKTYVTDGTSTRELPEGQSIEKMYQTANAMLKETAEVSYQESQQQAEEKEQESPSPKPKPRILEGNPDITAEEIKLPEGHHTHNNNGSNGNESDEDSKNKDNNGATAYQGQEQSQTVTVSDKHVEPASKAFDYGGELKILQDPTVESVDEGWGFGISTIQHAGENAPKVDLGFGELTPVAEKFNDNLGTTTQVFLDAEGHRFDKVIDNLDGNYQIVDGHGTETGISGNIKDDKLKLDFTDEGLKIVANEPTQQQEVKAVETPTQTNEVPVQTEFHQENNGFSLAQNGQTRSVTVESGKLHFQVSENGQTRDMTAKEANAFCQEVKAESTKADGFNHKLFDNIESMKHINDARGISSYAPEPRGNSGGGNVNSQTMTKGSGRGGM